MSKIIIEKQPISIDIDPITLNNDSISRTIVVSDFTINPIDSRISIAATLYYIKDKSFFVSNILKNKSANLIIDNSKIVEDSTGTYLCKENEIGDDTDLQSPCYGKDYLGEFDYVYNQISKNSYVIVDYVKAYFENNKSQFN